MNKSKIQNSKIEILIKIIPISVILLFAFFVFPVVKGAETIDVLSFMLKNDSSRGLSDNGTITFHQIISGSNIYLEKWLNEQQIVHYTYDSENIYMKDDSTAYHPYAFRPGIWAKRFMQVGEVIDMSTNLIDEFSVSCQPTATGRAWPYKNTLESHFPTYNAGGQLGTVDVIVIKYDWAPSYPDARIEREYFAKGYGIFRWEYWQDGVLNQVANLNTISNSTPISPDPICFNLNGTLKNSNAAFESITVPLTMETGRTYTASLIVRNLGSQTWTRAANVSMGSQNPQDNLNWGPGRIYLNPDDNILPGETKTFTFPVTAPASPGSYNFQWQMVWAPGGPGWFGKKSLNKIISVTTPTPTFTPTPTPTPSSILSGYNLCAYENAACSFTGTRSVAYGANGLFNFLALTNGTSCNNITFGDPIVGTVKACYIGSISAPTPTPAITSTPTPTPILIPTLTPTPIPAPTPTPVCHWWELCGPTPTPTPTTSPTPIPNWTFCADENGSCSFTGTKEVQYGANGRYYSGTFTNGANCSNNVFGDPIVGTVKACYIGSISAPTPTPTETLAPTPTPIPNWTFCADENGSCSFTGTKEVQYGANGRYYSGTFTNGANCSNNVFGDPIVGTVKSCWYRTISTPTPTLILESSQEVQTLKAQIDNIFNWLPNLFK